MTKLREQLASQVDAGETENAPVNDDADMFDDAPIAGPSKPRRTVFTDSLDTRACLCRLDLTEPLVRSANPLKALGRSSKGKQRAANDETASSRNVSLATVRLG